MDPWNRMIAYEPSADFEMDEFVRVRVGFIRQIGKAFPLSDTRKVFIQIPRRSEFEIFVPQQRDNRYVPSLVDIKHVKKVAKNTHQISRPTLSVEAPAPMDPPKKGSPVKPSSPGNEKVKALEVELAKLREMIALVVMKQEQISTHPPVSAPPELSSLRAVPLDVVAGSIPPPPPLPPATVFFGKGSKVSISEIIKNNKENSGSKGGASSSSSAPNGRPNMADVLKNLGSVKLKSVDRSPGGTPLRREGSDAIHDLKALDPAALITLALKKKFANRIPRESADDSSAWEEKENARIAEKKAEKKDTPLFGPHMLKKGNNVRAPLSPSNAKTVAFVN